LAARNVIELRKVEKTYLMGGRKVEALRGVDLKIPAGEYASIQGPSGSGKSTLLHLLGALDTPTHGTVLLDGHDISRLRDDELARVRGRKIGFIFQAFNLVPTLSALENVELPLIFQGVESHERTDRAQQLLHRVGLSERENHRPKELSGGEQQRVAVARALAAGPELLLADEPTGNLDTKTGGEILALLEALNREGKTLIIVTHEPEYARRARRRIFIRDGRVERQERSR
jgi:putative ABC transport system ATP-binding protein